MVSAYAGGTNPAATPNPVAAPSENFQRDWRSVPTRSAWKIVSATEVQFTHPPGKTKSKISDPVFARALDQTGTMQYEWWLKQADFKQGCVFYFFSTDAAARDSYALWLWQSNNKATGEKQNNVNVDKITNHKLVPVKSVPLELNEGDWNTVRLVFESAKGKFTVTCNGVEVLLATDPKPFTKGSHVALGSTAETASFKDMQIQRLP